MVEVPVGAKLEDESSKGNPYCNGEMNQPHYWIIPPANGASSLGKCKLCHEKRWFMNSNTADWWDDWRLGRPGKIINLPFGFQFERDDDV